LMSVWKSFHHPSLRRILLVAIPPSANQAQDLQFQCPSFLVLGCRKARSFADLSMSLVPSLGQLSANRARPCVRWTGPNFLVQVFLCLFTANFVLALYSKQLSRAIDGTWLELLNAIFQPLLPIEHPVHLLSDFLQLSLDRRSISVWISAMSWCSCWHSATARSVAVLISTSARSERVGSGMIAVGGGGDLDERRKSSGCN